MGDMPAIQHIPFQHIPQHSRLFLEYVALDDRALSFYRHPPTIGGVEESAREAIRNGIPRKELIEILMKQNESLHCGEKTRENIRALESEKCVAVVTGQQVGLFTGPAYTIYKALTALRLAEELRARNVRAVPVFWMESEDHDLAEVCRFTTLDTDFLAQTEDARGLLFGEQTSHQKSVGSIPIPQTIDSLIEIYLSRTAPGPGHADVGAWLKSTYNSGATLGAAFGQAMSQLFRDHGLILFDSQTPAARNLLSRLFDKAIEDADELRVALEDRTRSVVSAGFHGQVSIRDDSTLLFLQQDGMRSALVRKGTDFLVKNTDILLSGRALIGISREAPRELSPNVLLRPLVQDSLFPTAAYVGGPAEVAYFAQIGILYRHFNLPMPAIWPRTSMAIVDADLARKWREFGLSYQDCFTKRDGIVQKILKGDSSNDRVLNELRKELPQRLGALRPLVKKIDPTLEGSVATAERKILHNIDKLQAKITKLEERQNEALLATADQYIHQCYPDRRLQERALGIAYFLSRYGFDFIHKLYALVEIDQFDHMIIELERTAP